LGLLDGKLPEIDVRDIFVPGRITVLDLSDSGDAVRNLVIAYHLDKIFKAKIENERTFATPILLLIEEVHTFLSKERRRQMVGTLNLMMELARRGRKRGISVGLVSQQPSHLPTELLETVNTRVIHRLSSIANIRVLKESTGNVPESLWESLPSLGKGQALVASPSYNHAVVTKIRPSMSRRIRVD
jgi:DNA helicase HerA-like ATPase